MSKKVKAATVLKKDPVQPVNPFLERFEKQTVWHIVLLLLLPFFVYIKTAGFELIDMDDIAIIKNNFHILGNIRNIGIAFKTDAFLGSHGDFYRPMQTVSFMIDAWIGGDKPWIYHLSSLIYHILTVISLYFFLRSLKIKPLTALFAALLFSVHPLLTAAVSWIPARGDIFIGLFGILLFNTFTQYFKKGKKLVYGLLHFALFFLALFSKEVAILFPLLLLFYYFFIREEEKQTIGTHIKNLLPFIVVWASLLVVFLLMRNKVVIGTPPGFILGIAPFINNLPAIPIVAGKFFIPAALSTMPLFDNAYTITGTVTLILLLVLAIRYARAKKWLFVMGLAWFILFIIPPMFFKIFYSNYLVEYYEHRTYLPLAGLFIALAVVLNGRLFKSRNRFINLLPLLIILLFTFLASAHSDDFKNSIAFFGRAAALNNPGACVKRGELYFNERDFPNALADFEKAIELSAGEYPPAFYNRGNYRSAVLKDHIGAEADYSSAITLDSIVSLKVTQGLSAPTYIEAFIKRANERISTQNIPGALADLDQAKKIDSSNALVYFTLGSVYVNAQQYQAAINGFSRSIALDSGNAEAYNNRGFAFYKLEDYATAMKDYTKAVDLMPEYLNARYNKGMIYFTTGQADSAIKQFDSTLMLANNFYFGYFYRGMAKKLKNDTDGACKDWQESVKLGFDMAQDTIRKYCK